jgi:excisionase family DNA binding protein
MTQQATEFANFISSSEASRTFGVSTAYITKLARAKLIKALKIGRNWIIERDSLQTYLTTPQKRGPKSKSKALHVNAD